MALETIRRGSREPLVLYLQSCLSRFFPYPEPLEADQIFGPLTQQRVMRFQREAGLAVDGVVGPRTWGAIRDRLPNLPVPTVSRRGCDCGTCDPANAGRARQFEPLLNMFQAQQTQTRSGLVSSPMRIGGGISTKAVVGTPMETELRDVYGDSLDYDRIIITDQTGAQNRPFTVAIGHRGDSIVIMNLGTLEPLTITLVHEAAHAWQSQHHANPQEFMKNCGVSQGAAMAANLLIFKIMAPETLDPGYPVNYPYSAYAYWPGKSFGMYAGEQIARQIENGEAAIVAHAKSVAKNAIDGENTRSLAGIHINDKRVAGVKY